MRLYLDTNILVYLLLGNAKDEICHDVLSELFDYSNTLYTSSVCVHEMIHLFQIGKIEWKKSNEETNNIMDWMSSQGICIAQVNERHLAEYALLPMHGDHRDPNDRLIIAQAILDRATIVTSDRKFEKYLSDGLSLIFNDR